MNAGLFGRMFVWSLDWLNVFMADGLVNYLNGGWVGRMSDGGLVGEIFEAEWVNRIFYGRLVGRMFVWLLDWLDVCMASGLVGCLNGGFVRRLFERWVVK